MNAHVLLGYVWVQTVIVAILCNYEYGTHFCLTSHVVENCKIQQTNSAVLLDYCIVCFPIILGEETVSYVVDYWFYIFKGNW